MQNIIKKYFSALGFFLAVVILATTINSLSYKNLNTVSKSAAVFNPTDLPAYAKTASGFAWNDNVGWINFGEGTERVPGRVYVSDDKLLGYAWGENIGWISMNCNNTDSDENCTTYGVKQDPSKSGTLTGYAWGENIGWISFNCSNTSSCGVSDYKVSITTDIEGVNTFSGYAWGENIGWISFNDSGDQGVFTNWLYPSYTITYTATSTTPGTAGGTIIGTSTQLIREGNDGTEVTATSSQGYHFVNWSDDSTSTSRIDLNITSDTDITANFALNGNPPKIVDPDCSFVYSSWSDCINGEKTRTVSPDPTSCPNINESLSQECTPEIKITIDSLSKTTISTGDIIDFKATVTGTTSTGVIWNITNTPIAEDGYYGTINDAGHYIAPSFENAPRLNTLVVEVEAKSLADLTKTDKILITVNRKPLCTDYTYSDWSNCINSIQTRTALTSIPVNCTGGVAEIVSQSCIMPISTSTCASYTYTDWSDCLNNKQSRTTLTSNPANCTGGEKQITEQSCTMAPALIIPEIPSSIDNVKKDTQNNNSPETKRSSSGHSSGNSPTGNVVVDNIVSVLDVSSFVTNNVAVLGTTTEKIVIGAQKILESPTGNAVVKTITTAGVVGGGVAATGVFALNGTVAADLLFLPFKLWGLLLSVLGLKKRNRPWGTVYDSVTKQPIDPAYVTITNVETKKDETSITDLDGRYGFLVAPGRYTIAANKTNYTFPSVKMAGKTSDVLYGNLYFGEEISTPVSGAVISKNIPLDPIKFDWNEFVKGQKKLMKFYSTREKVLRIITDWIFRIGFIISVVSLFLVSAPYNLIIFGLYLVLYAVRKMGLRQKALGALTDKDGIPLSYAIIRVFASDLNVEITNKVADKIGKYYCLVSKGKYYVKIEKKNDDESYTEVFTSPVFEAEDGIVNKSFTI